MTEPSHDPFPLALLRRAALPLRLLVPRRRLAPGPADPARARARLSRARADRSQRTLRLDGVRPRREAERPDADHRRGADAARVFRRAGCRRLIAPRPARSP